VTLWGADRISDIFAGKKIEISPLSFYQVNKPQAEVLYETAADFLGRDAGDYLLDLYCGMGTIGMYMSDMAGHVCGVEQVPQAVDDARRNAALNGIKNMEFICADAGTAAEKLAGDGVKPDTITVDPPRKGLDETAKKALLTMAPERIAYVSCDPATIARDIFELTSNGEYRLMRVRPVDMFPRSAHVETVVLMSKAEGK
jgi:23S rRNA (uracil1939-C5)-methyltransferase